MSYIGNSPETAHYPQQLENGDGSTVSFALDHSVVSATSVIVHVGGVYQVASAGYTISSGNIVFTSAPPTGTNNIEIVFRGVQVQIPTPADGSVVAVKMESGEIPFAKSFTSSEQTITSAGSLTIPHGLSASPLLIQARLICKTAEIGYSIGDEVVLSMYGSDAVNSFGASVVIDTINIDIRYGSHANVFLLINKTTGAVSSITLANWKLIVRAWS